MLVEAELVPKQAAFAAKYSEQKTGVLASEADLLQGMIARGFKPSIDISGVQIGTVDDAVRTIIPDLARAQITSRLVPNQNPQRCLEILQKHFESYLRPGISFKILNQTEGSAGIRFSAESPYVQCASEVLARVTGNQPLYDWEGSSIPFVSWAVPKIAPEALIVGFGLEQDAVHSANESFELSQFKKGFEYCCELLIAIAKGTK
jgi:acetylornithine deacetylase/succinyl-diaminopimelate desuccinylase-like protein